MKRQIKTILEALSKIKIYFRGIKVTYLKVQIINLVINQKAKERINYLTNISKSFTEPSP